MPKKLTQPNGTGEGSLAESVSKALRHSGAEMPPLDPSRYSATSAPLEDARTRAQRDADAERARREFLDSLRGKSPAEVAAAYAARFAPAPVEPFAPLPEGVRKPVEDEALARFEELYAGVSAEAGVSRGQARRTAAVLEHEEAREQYKREQHSGGDKKRKRRDDPRRKFFRDRGKRARERTWRDTSKYQVAPWMDLEQSAKDAAERTKFEQAWRNQYGDQPVPEHRLRPDDYFFTQMIVDDRRGKMAAEALTRLSRASMTFAHGVYWAAVGQLADNTPRLDLTAERARMVVAANYALWCMSTLSQRLGFGRKVRDTNLHYIARALGNRGNADRHWCEQCKCNHVHVNTLTGLHRVDGNWANGRLGYLRGASETGALRIFKATNPEHLKRLAALGKTGPSGYACNEYDLATDPVERERLVEELRKFGDREAIASQLRAQQSPRVRSKFQRGEAPAPEPDQQPP